MDIDDFCTREKELKQGKETNTKNEISEFTKELSKYLLAVGGVGIVTSTIKGISNIINRDNEITYNVLSRMKGNDYTLLSYEDDGIKVLKVENSKLPENTNSRTVLKVRDGEFIINEKATKQNEKEWIKAQKNVNEKDGNIYIIEGIADDYVYVMDVKTGEYFESETIGRNLAKTFQEGDSVKIEDGKSILYEGEIKGKKEKIQKEIDKLLERKNRERMRKAKNLEEDSIYMIKNINGDRITLINVNDGDKFPIDVYGTEYEKEMRYESGLYSSMHEMSKENFEKIFIGGCLIVESGKYIPYDGKYEVGSDKAKKEIEKIHNEIENDEKSRQEGDIFAVNYVHNRNVSLLNLRTGKETKDTNIHKELRENIDTGDFIKIENGKYVKYDEEIVVNDEELKEKLEKLALTKEVLTSGYPREKIEGAIYIVTSLNDSKENGIMLYNTQTGNRFHTQTMIEDRILNKLKLGDKLILKNGQYIEYDGEIKLNNEKLQKELEETFEYIEKQCELQEKAKREGAIYYVSDIGENDICLKGTDERMVFFPKKADCVEVKIGDFVKYENGKYAKYEGEVTVGSKEILDDIKLLYDYIVDIG